MREQHVLNIYWNVRYTNIQTSRFKETNLQVDIDMCICMYARMTTYTIAGHF